MFIVSFFYLDEDIGQVIVSFAIYFSLLSAYAFSIVKIDFLESALKSIAIIALILLPYILISQQIDIFAALKRAYTWTEIFYYGPLFWGVIPFVVLSVLQNKNIRLSILYWTGAVILNLIFLKRFIIIDSLLLLFAIFCIYLLKREKVTKIFKLLFFIVILVGSIFYFKADSISLLFESTSNRIETSSEDIGGFDRFMESMTYFENANIFELTLGKGFASTHRGLGHKSYALHMGWGNFILKGGIFYLILIIIPLIKLVFLSTRINKLPIKIQFSFWLLFIFSFRLFYTNMHNLSPEMLFFFYAIFNIMDYQKNALVTYYTK